ncbi:hypothetical protein [Desulfosporosinus sp. Sb-LF]|uniref:hypothetical protein n=1 Tax=Desulfosporosinus sp. Sb-LF TaxID=2560027 RepID=UPI00107FB04C|nr:hypothetical protein [Desulfosporosinus sp. Sb-LF]TGE31129.1 hypothetical protein E4K68_19005 [Desulfosporosinus sp. Sb-LF]
MKNEQTIPWYEVDTLVLEELNQLQVKHIGRILEIIGRYMLLSTEMLFELYIQDYKEKLGLSFLKKAVREKLVIEYKYDLGQSSEQDVYFYALKTSAYHVLDRAALPYIKIPYLSAYEEKKRIITANQYFLNRGYVPDLKFPIPLSRTLKFFYALNPKAERQKIVGYFPSIVSQFAIERFFRKFETKEGSLDNITFEKITNKLIPFGQYTKATHPKNAWIKSNLGS